MYKFRMETDRPTVGYSRPIPFSVRPVVKEQITQMISDILEISDSPFLEQLDYSQEGGQKAKNMC